MKRTVLSTIKKNFLLIVGLMVISLSISCASLGLSGEKSKKILPYSISEKGINGRVFIVSPDGDDLGEGTEKDPLKSIQEAADRTLPGDTVLIRTGVYTNIESFSVADIQNSGSERNWIRYANYPGEQPLIRFNSLRGFRISASYVLVEGLEFDGQNYLVDPDEATRYAESYQGRDHSQTRFFGVGIRVDSETDEKPHHVILRKNKVHHTSGGGIATAQADYVLIENNTIWKTSFYTPWGGSAISVWQSVDYDKNQGEYRTVIKDNICYQNDNKVKFWMMKDFTDGNGIILDQLSKDSGLIDSGFLGPYTGRVLIVNNLSFYNGGKGINIFESGNIDVFHNTLYKNSLRGNMKNEIEIGRADFCRFENNILVTAENRNAFGGYQYKNILIKNNLIQGREFSGFKQLSNFFTEDSAFVQVPVQSENKIDLSQVDLGLQAQSPAREKGISSGYFPVDHNNKKRLMPTDLGALEYQP